VTGWTKLGKTLSSNASKTKPAKLLAVFVVDE